MISGGCALFPDPAEEPAHDVLAAKAFRRPAPASLLRHRSFVSTDDPRI